MSTPDAYQLILDEAAQQRATEYERWIDAALSQYEAQAPAREALLDCLPLEHTVTHCGEPFGYAEVLAYTKDGQTEDVVCRSAPDRCYNGWRYRVVTLCPPYRFFNVYSDTPDVFSRGYCLTPTAMAQLRQEADFQ